jgi:hypothetical protein
VKKFLFIINLNFYIGITAQVSTMLPIAPRIQWPNNNGYCGENSIQACGLYYGNYISEGLCRTIAGGELLIYVNDTIALDAFSFTYKEWNPNVATPQYSSYLDWVKQYLYKKQPVIITVYVSGMTDPDYDHIIPAIGFKAANVNTYATTDSLTYNSNFDPLPFTRVFSTLYATRANANNSAPFPYYIPKNVNYGVAVTGNKDPNHLSKPVHIDLDSNDEPNISIGAAACVLKATITIDSLTTGQSYALLRYNNYQNVPSFSFNPAGASSVVYFMATATTKTLADTFMSNAGVFYRCIAYSATDIKANSNMSDLACAVYPNPSKGVFVIETQNAKHDVYCTLFDVNGKVVLTQAIQSISNASANKFTIDASNLSEGVYNVSITSHEEIINKRLVIVK